MSTPVFPTVGARVLVIKEVSGRTCHAYGLGTFNGPTMNGSALDSKITLDGGAIVFGSECKLMPESALHMFKDMGVELVDADINQDRAVNQRVQTAMIRLATDTLEREPKSLKPVSSLVEKQGGVSWLTAVFSVRRRLTSTEMAEIDAILTPSNKGQAS